LHDVTPELVIRSVGMLEPDCVLLDGQSPEGYGTSWDLAASLAARSRPVPVVMFTAHGPDVREARDGASPRSEMANLSGIVTKPFQLDELIDVVATAIGRSTPFDHSIEADAERTRA